MKYSEREKIVEALPYESRVGFIAFCVARCFSEASRHPIPAAQLAQLPLLTEGLEMLWKRAEEGVLPDPERIKQILEHLSTYEIPAADAENVLYRFDVTLVNGARMLVKGMHVLQDSSQATPRYVSGALEGVVQSIGVIYAAWQESRKAELEIIDTALLRLHEWGNKPFSRAVFDGIPDWKRGELSKKYAENRLKGSAEDDDE